MIPRKPRLQLDASRLSEVFSRWGALEGMSLFFRRSGAVALLLRASARGMICSGT